MSILLTSDIHMSENPLAAYRWGLFEWLAKEGAARNVDGFAILGDLTEGKDRHSAELVNRLVDGVSQMAMVAPVYILKANHDYVDEAWPFFRFLNNNPDIHYIVRPGGMRIGPRRKPNTRLEPDRSCNALFLPHTRTPDKDWPVKDFNQFDVIFCHQTFDGAKSESGYILDGMSPKIFDGYKGKVWSGDIHVPQRVNKTIEYVGSPFRIHFGDTFEPRVILLNDDRRPTELTFDTLFRHTFDISDIDDLKGLAKEAVEGDQVKIRVTLKRSEFPDWPARRKEIIEFAQRKGWQVCGLEPRIKPESQRITSRDVGHQNLSDPQEVLSEYCEENAIAKALAKVGAKLLEGAL